LEWYTKSLKEQALEEGIHLPENFDYEAMFHQSSVRCDEKKKEQLISPSQEGTSPPKVIPKPTPTVTTTTTLASPRVTPVPTFTDDQQQLDWYIKTLKEQAAESGIEIPEDFDYEGMLLARTGTRDDNQGEKQHNNLNQEDKTTTSHTSAISVKLTSTPKTGRKRNKISFPRRLPVIPEEDEEKLPEETHSPDKKQLTVSTTAPNFIAVSSSVGKPLETSELPVSDSLSKTETPVSTSLSQTEISEEAETHVSTGLCHTDIPEEAETPVYIPEDNSLTHEPVTCLAPEPTHSRPHRHERFYNNMYDQQ
jgi:hypothetical protein